MSTTEETTAGKATMREQIAVWKPTRPASVYSVLDDMDDLAAILSEDGELGVTWLQRGRDMLEDMMAVLDALKEKEDDDE